jgi:hypothetical protein
MVKTKEFVEQHYLHPPEDFLNVNKDVNVNLLLVNLKLMMLYTANMQWTLHAVLMLNGVIADYVMDVYGDLM